MSVCVKMCILMSPRWNKAKFIKPIYLSRSRIHRSKCHVIKHKFRLNVTKVVVFMPYNNKRKIILVGFREYKIAKLTNSYCLPPPVGRGPSQGTLIAYQSQLHDWMFSEMSHQAFLQLKLISAQLHLHFRIAKKSQWHYGTFYWWKN